MRGSTGKSNGASTHEAGPDGVTPAVGGGVSVAEAGADVGDGGEVGVGDSPPPHPATSPSNRIVSNSAGLRIEDSFVKTVGDIVP